ncbi:Peptidase inhibitor family I36 [Lentzea xinjiangensis]|uniref:Peptidase inhibitor family I36 n=1 Tax=Lentzea xinjiangensis TaxID=402600 RepID=A0A1H9QEH2_9PSEU|nr:peptidase inhibitor family I36 protein [Lentzea xinjiangensis]SER58828.1 Peptidase inhibitor family I36 [Lentzea xinjiangensis]
MKTVNKFGVVFAAVATMSALTSTTTQAAPAVTRSTLDRLIAANPGAQQTSANSVRLANGVEAVIREAGPCTGGWLCLYDSHNFSVSGRQLDLQNCGFVNIGDMGWSDKVRSYRNYKPQGTVSIFMNWTGSSWQEVERSTAVQEKPYVDDAYNADGVWVC